MVYSSAREWQLPPYADISSTCQGQELPRGLVCGATNETFWTGPGPGDRLSGGGAAQDADRGAGFGSTGTFCISFVLVMAHSRVPLSELL